MSGPGGSELGPVGDNKQDAGLVDLVYDQLKQLEACGIYPVHILENAQRRALGGENRIMSTSLLTVLFLICCGVSSDSSWF